MYARRKGWPLEAVRLELTHDRVHAENCENCEEETGMVEVISRHIQFKGPLVTEQRERLAYIATWCPVHKSLASGVPVVDTLG